jgi:hypothetical protein
MALGKMAEKMAAPASTALAVEDIPTEVAVLLAEVEAADGNRRAYFEGAFDPAETVHVKAWLSDKYIAAHGGTGEVEAFSVETKAGKPGANVAADERRSHEKRAGTRAFRRAPLSVSKDGEVAIVELIPNGFTRDQALVVLYGPAAATIHKLNVVLA